MRVRTAAIVAVGSELLTPLRLDTNSLWLAGQLDAIGIRLVGKFVVADTRERLVACLRRALDDADLVLTSGGLGPTDDDVTREAAAECLGRPLVEDAEVLAGIERRFASRGLRMPAINRRQAGVVPGAQVLPNGTGSAPGQWIAVGDRLLVLLPGPPHELQLMFEHEVRPRLAGLGGRPLVRRVVRASGRAESQVEELVQPFYAGWRTGRPPIDITILASPGVIELHLSAADEPDAPADPALEQAVAQVRAALGPALVSSDGSSLEQVVGALLGRTGRTIAVAESCTGGLVLGTLTRVAGSSGWVKGGVVAYSNAVKVGLLGVDDAVIAAHGAVSAPVAEAMASGVREALVADVGVGVTGIAGPDGGSAEKPVGTVWIAVDGRARHVRRFVFPGDRETIRRHAVSAALNLVRQTEGELDSPQSSHAGVSGTDTR